MKDEGVKDPRKISTKKEDLKGLMKRNTQVVIMKMILQKERSLVKKFVKIHGIYRVFVYRRFFSATVKDLQFSSNLDILWLILKLRLVQTSMFAEICKKVHKTYED